jgi:hypothetical protein
MSGAAKTPASAPPGEQDADAPPPTDEAARVPGRDSSDMSLEEKTKRDREAGDVADDLADFA